MNNKKGFNDNRIVLVIACIVILVFILLVIKNINTLNNFTEEISNQNAEYKTNKAELDELQNLLLKKPELEQAQGILQNQIPQGLQEYDIIEYINSVAVDNGASLFDIRLDANKLKGDSNKIKEMPVSLILKGPYTSLAEFINDLSSGRRLFRIDKIQLQGEEGPDGIVNASVSANAFYK